MATPITGVRIRLAISATLAIIGAAAGARPLSCDLVARGQGAGGAGDCGAGLAGYAGGDHGAGCEVAASVGFHHHFPQRGFHLAVPPAQRDGGRDRGLAAGGRGPPGHADLRRLVIEDIDQIEDLIAPAIPDPAQGIALPCLTFAALALIDWRLALAAVTLFPLLLWLYPLTICAPREDYGRWYAALARLREATRHLVGGIAVIRAFVGAERGFDAHEQAVAAVRETGYHAGTASLWQMSLPYTGLRGNGQVLIPVGAAVFLGGDASAQDLVLLLLLGLNASALRLIFTAGNFTWWMKAAMARMAKIRGIPLLEQLEPAGVPRGNGLALERVALSPGERVILRDISLSVPRRGHARHRRPIGGGQDDAFAGDGPGCRPDHPGRRRSAANSGRHAACTVLGRAATGMADRCDHPREYPRGPALGLGCRGG